MYRKVGQGKMMPHQRLSAVGRCSTGYAILFKLNRYVPEYTVFRT